MSPNEYKYCTNWNKWKDRKSEILDGSLLLSTLQGVYKAPKR